MKNGSELRNGACVLAAAFLQEFAGDGPWAHVDMAGPGYLSRRRPGLRARRGRLRLRRAADRRARAEARVNFDLEPEHELIRDTVRQFALEQVAPVAEELDREKRFPYELVAELAELGLMGMTIPEEYGGAGADTLSYAIAVEELTRIDSSVAITRRRPPLPRHAADLVLRHRGAEARWLPELASGAKLAAFGLTEANAGSDAGATRTTARLERRRVGRRRLEDLHHERRHRHHRLRDDHRASPATARSRTSSSRTARRGT